FPFPFAANKVTLRWLESVKVTEVTLHWEGLLTVTAVAATKFVPTIVNVADALCAVIGAAEFGEVIVGPVLTVNTPVPVPVPPSGLVTVTLRVPEVALPAIVTFAVRVVAVTNVVEFTVIPVPENDAASPTPAAKPVPVTVTFPLKLCPRLAGVVE